MNLDKLTPEEKFVVRWQYEQHDGFSAELAKAIALADDFNLARLARGFPNEVNGFLRYNREVGWWDKVRKKAGII